MRPFESPELTVWLVADYQPDSNAVVDLSNPGKLSRGSQCGHMCLKRVHRAVDDDAAGVGPSHRDAVGHPNV